MTKAAGAAPARGFALRAAELRDVAPIVALIRELAEFERLAHLLQVTPEKLRPHLFGERPVAEAMVAEVGGELIPFEVKYRAQHTGARELKGLVELCHSKRIERGYVVTKSLDDFGLMQGLAAGTQVMRVPAPLLCYWMGATELPGPNS